jgi:hypothetical protein
MVGKFIKGALLPLLPFIIIVFLIVYFKDVIIRLLSIKDKKATSDLVLKGKNDYTKGLSKDVVIGLVNRLIDAFNSREPLYGTDERVVFKVFDLVKTKEDFLKLYEVFGKRSYNDNNSPPEGGWRFFDDYQDRDLVYWLSSEIDPVEDEELWLKVEKIVILSGFVF